MKNEHDLPDGKWNSEYAKKLEQESTTKLHCKNCGSTEFCILENKAYTDYRNFFATVEACAKCGLIAIAPNTVGHTTETYKAYDLKPIDPKFVLTIAKQITPNELPDKVLIEFLEDCINYPDRTIKPKFESDRKYLLKLLDWCFYDIQPRAQELLNFYKKDMTQNDEKTA